MIELVQLGIFFRLDEFDVHIWAINVYSALLFFPRIDHQSQTLNCQCTCIKVFVHLDG